MTGQVVEDDDMAGLQRRRELGFDIEIEHLAVHRPVDDPRCVQPVMAQGADEGLAAPMPKRCVIDQAPSVAYPSVVPAQSSRRPAASTTSLSLLLQFHDSSMTCACGLYSLEPRTERFSLHSQFARGIWQKFAVH